MASIKEVAKRAGVSISTVSRYVNHSAYVDEAKGKAIQEAMDYYHYTPSQFGRGLATGHTDLIGVDVFSTLFQETEQSFFDEGYTLGILKGIETSLRGRKYAMVILTDHYGSQDGEKKVPRYVEFFRQRKVDGLILTGMSTEVMKSATYKEIRDQNFPLVYIGRKQHRDGMNVYAGFTPYHVDMVRRLYDLGHRKIWMNIVQLHHAYQGEIARKVHKTMPDLDLHMHILSKEYGISYCLEEILKNGYTAVCTQSLREVRDLYLLCAERGIRIPEDLSVFTVGNSQDETDGMSPRPDMYCVNARKLGEAAASMLIEAIESGKPESRTMEIPAEYVKGESIAEPGK